MNTPRALPRRSSLVAVLSLALVLAAPAARAQSPAQVWAWAQSAAAQPEAAGDRTKVQAARAARTRQLSDRNAALLLAGPVDPGTYVLGPGDVVGLEISGAFSISAEDVVGADGSVTFPQLGTFWFGGRTLAEARTELRTKGRSLVRGAEPLLLLKTPRTFKVHVTGAVELPGSQAATPLTRVSEVIEAAGGLSSQADFRNIHITHRDSTASQADLLPFLLGGMVDKNLLLRDGDVVTVNLSTDDIYILGAVVHPGRYDYVRGDEMGDLLALVGLHPRADSTRAILQRFRDSSRWDTVSVELEPIRQGVTQVPLRAGDRILIRAIGDWHGRSTMEVQGAVAFPGPIPIQRGTVTASQAIEMAGGFLADAVPSRVILAKPLLPDTVAATNPATGVKTSAVVGKTERLHERTLDLTAGSGPLMEPGDILHVPRSDAWVEVLGRVRNPGFYAHHPDWRARDYVDAAGGYGKYADTGKTMVSKGRFGEVGYAYDLETLAPGDVVWVPEKIPQGFWMTVRDIVVAAGQGAAFLLVVRDLSR